ncbi:MFS transporter [Caldanaerobacter subterraneus]|uniref:MFS transporter n=3 Tax=Caldanaerobacter subterraneus TaxID=911092 RepID=A0A357VL29_9THEO|nr:MFS transporter [Caldanaerobacter subterraneus]TCO66309.1 MFS transporter [Caldanaerobacter subterraneus]HBT49074.1 MFS transporter [Caldanaerobacter subterraneus]
MQNLKRNERFFLTVTLFSSFFTSLMAPFWVIYFNKINLDFSQISLLIIINHIAVMLFEIPTGALADTYSRKFSVLLSLLIGSLTSIGIYFNTSFTVLLFLYFLSGVGATLNSGAFESWFADSFLLGQKEMDLTKYWGRLTSFNYLGSTIGFLGGSVLVRYNIFREIWLIEGIGIFLVFIYVFLAGKEAKLQKKTDEYSYREYFNKIAKGTVYLFKHRILLSITVGSFFFFFSSGIMSMLWQPYFERAGIPVELFGIILALTMVLSIFVPRYADRIGERFKGAARTLMIVSITSALFIFMMYAIPKYSFIPYIIYTAVYSAHTPIFMSYFNKLIPSSERATIISIYSLFISVSTILCTYSFGVLSDKKGLYAALFLSLITALISSIPFKRAIGLEKELCL